MIGSRAKGRCTFTTDLTPAEGRGPRSGDGRQLSRGTAIKQPEQQFCCRLLFKVEQFYGITRPAALIMPQNPRRNLYGPMKRWGTSPPILLRPNVLLHGALHFSLCITVGHIITLIVIVLTLAEPDLHFYMRAGKIEGKRYDGIPIA